MSAGGSDTRSSLRSNLGEGLFERNPLASVELFDRARDHSIELRTFGIGHSGIIIGLYAVQQGMRDLSAHEPVEREDLLEELLRNGHAQAYPNAVVNGDRGLRSAVQEVGAAIVGQLVNDSSPEPRTSGSTSAMNAG